MINLTINSSKNLLAFSGGVDSSALFFLLVNQNIPFDIAIVDYKQRTNSKDEVNYAIMLSKKYHKKCFVATFPKDLIFNEKNARTFRYDFFEKIIKKYQYETLLTAHQLNDKLEWFLMQLSKGAGLNELLGVEEFSYKKNYTIQRPLLKYTKEQLQTYLEQNNYHYFIDETNFDTNYKRNYFRHHFSNQFIKEYQKGIIKSFDYLHKDKDSLLAKVQKKAIQQLHIYSFDGDDNIAIKLIDQDLKNRNILLTKKTRDEIIQKKELVISHKIAVAITKNKIYIAPYLKTTMDKDFKEQCRINKIPKHIRAYLYTLGLKKFTF